MQFVDDLPDTRIAREEPIDWATLKAELVANPGQWGLMVENVSVSQAGQLRDGKNATFRDELSKFEFRMRRPKDKQYAVRRSDLYGRYIGDAV
jgi:hypothetical protein